MSDLVQAVTDAQFDAEVLKAAQPVLVDFWAPWCGPCRMLAPTLDALAQEFSGRLQFKKMNVDENTETPAKYSVRGIPALMLFKNGELIGNKVGVVPKSELVTFFEEHL